MTNPTLERIARAMGEADGVVWTKGYVQYRAADAPEDETTPQRYERLAIAALTELLQLDDSTVDAGLRQQRECTFDGTSSAPCAPEHVFVAMIKSILSEKDHG